MKSDSRPWEISCIRTESRLSKILLKRGRTVTGLQLCLSVCSSLLNRGVTCRIFQWEGFQLFAIEVFRIFYCTVCNRSLLHKRATQLIMHSVVGSMVSSMLKQQTTPLVNPGLNVKSPRREEQADRILTFRVAKVELLYK